MTRCPGTSAGEPPGAETTRSPQLPVAKGSVPAMPGSMRSVGPGPWPCGVRRTGLAVVLPGSSDRAKGRHATVCEGDPAAGVDQRGCRRTPLVVLPPEVEPDTILSFLTQRLGQFDETVWTSTEHHERLGVGWLFPGPSRHRAAGRGRVRGRTIYRNFRCNFRRTLIRRFLIYRPMHVHPGLREFSVHDRSGYARAATSRNPPGQGR